MKKSIVMLVCSLFIGVAGAQENGQTQKAKKFELGYNVGVTTFNNYSSLSLFQDATDSYSAFSEGVYLGIRSENVLLGVQFQFASFNTSAINLDETAFWMDFSLMARRYVSLGGNWDIFLGAKLGLGDIHNRFSYLGTDYTRNRLGLSSEIEMGVDYRVSRNSYIGLRAAYNGLGVQKVDDLPAGLVKNKKQSLVGYSLMIHCGINF